MPEGDTIFRTARSIGRALIGKPVTVFRSTYPLLTRFNDDTPLAGQTVDSVEARGKWLLIYFSGGGILASHLLMNGRWHIYRHGECWQLPRFHMRIVIENNQYQAVGFRVPVAEMHTARSLARNMRIPRAENDLLSAEFDAGAALDRLTARLDDAIADALLDQSVLAGIGNVFKSEICFVNGLSPFRKIGSLTRDQAAKTIASAQRLLKANVLVDSGDLIVTYRGQQRRTTHELDPGASLWVYGRNGEPCRHCGEAIRRRIQGDDARVTFWCPRCQPLPDGSDVDG
jgi:endonuclease-8